MKVSGSGFKVNALTVRSQRSCDGKYTTSDYIYMGLLK